MNSLVLFNNKGGVGKTTLTFNIAHMMARCGLRTVVLDYDPQCNISSIFLSEDELTTLWEYDGLGLSKGGGGLTVVACLDKVRRGTGTVADPALHQVADNLWLLPGHLSLSRFESKLAIQWAQSTAQDNEEAVGVVTSLDQLSDRAALTVDADIILVDVGPSLGALNRSALLSCDFLIVPLAPDLFSQQGLKNVGPTLKQWRNDWHTARDRGDGAVIGGEFRPIGYILQQHLVRADQPAQAYLRWASQIPQIYHEFVATDESLSAEARKNLTLATDPARIALLRHYASLIPMAQQARKPLFMLSRADGIGSRGYLVERAAEDFRAMVVEILKRMGGLDPAVPTESPP